MSGGGSASRRAAAVGGSSPIEEFGKLVESALKDGDASAVVAWVEARLTDSAAIDRLVDAWSDAAREPRGCDRPAEILWPLAALRGGLRPEHLERIKTASSPLLSPRPRRAWGPREDERLRAILRLIFGDVDGERMSLRRYLLEKKDFQSARAANLFALLGTPNLDVVRERFLDEDGRLIRGGGRDPGLLFGVVELPGANIHAGAGPETPAPARNLRKDDQQGHSPGMAVERTKDTRNEPVTATGGLVDLEREVFSPGVEVARMRILHLVGALAERLPEGRERSELESQLIAAISRGKAREASSAGAGDKAPADVQVSKKLQLPERTGHALIEDVVDLWDARESLPRGEFTARFQRVLDAFHEAKNLGDYEANRTLCRWIGTIARVENFKLLLKTGGSTSVAVTIKCTRQSPQGYFIPREARKVPKNVKGHSSPSFPRLEAVAL